MSTDTTPASIGADAALALLVAAVEAETDPSWECNSYHPSLWSALDVARAALASAVQPPAAVGEKFQRAWLQLDQLPGRMMIGPGGRFGPVPASCSAWVTTSERERDNCRAEGKTMLEVWLAAAPKAEPAAVAGHEVLCWVPEDELPESITSDAYNTLFKYSRVDGIRWFPVFGQSAQTLQPAPAAQEDAASTGFFLQLPQRPKPEAPAGTVGLDWDAYSGAQMLAYGRDCSDAAIVATQKTGCV